MPTDDCPPGTNPDTGHTHIGGPGAAKALTVPDVYTSPALSLSLPPSILAEVSQGRLNELNVIQVKYARDVAHLLAKSYSDVLKVIEPAASEASPART